MAANDPVTAVQAALERDPDINLHRFPVRVSQDERNNALLVEGTVEDIVALRKILQIARHQSGSGRVTDKLHIRTGSERSGDQLREAVIRTLASEPAFRDTRVGDDRHGAPSGLSHDQDWIVVSVSGTGVHLEGRQHSLADRRLAEVLAWWVPGTSRVENRIHVQPPEQDSDQELTEAVRIVLEKDPSLDAGQIHARVQQQKVILEGSVLSAVNRRIASRDCWYIPGVHAVDNQIHVLE